MSRSPIAALVGRSSRMPRGAAVLAFGILACGSASADVFDLSFQRLVLPPTTMGQFADPGSAENINAGALKAYRQVISEMSVALAPKVLTTADTVGYSGFQFTLDYSFTTISNKACPGTSPEMTKDQCPWQFAVEGGHDSAGSHTSPPGVAHTVSVMVRKGIW